MRVPLRIVNGISYVHGPYLGKWHGFYPETSGVYFLMDGREVVYVGMSQHNLRKRLATHQHKRKIISGDLHVRFICRPAPLCPVLERVAIECYQPRMNYFGVRPEIRARVWPKRTKKQPAA